MDRVKKDMCYLQKHTKKMSERKSNRFLVTWFMPVVTGQGTSPNPNKMNLSLDLLTKSIAYIGSKS